MHIKNWKIGTRLGAGLGVAVLFMVGISIIGINIENGLTEVTVTVPSFGAATGLMTFDGTHHWVANTDDKKRAAARTFKRSERLQLL